MPVRGVCHGNSARRRRYSHCTLCDLSTWLVISRTRRLTLQPPLCPHLAALPTASSRRWLHFCNIKDQDSRARFRAGRPGLGMPSCCSSRLVQSRPAQPRCCGSPLYRRRACGFSPLLARQVGPTIELVHPKATNLSSEVLPCLSESIEEISSKVRPQELPLFPPGWVEIQGRFPPPIRPRRASTS